jgi:hypothetical protein
VLSHPSSLRNALLLTFDYLAEISNRKLGLRGHYNNFFFFFFFFFISTLREYTNQPNYKMQVKGGSPRDGEVKRKEGKEDMGMLPE